MTTSAAVSGTQPVRDHAGIAALLGSGLRIRGAEVLPGTGAQPVFGRPSGNCRFGVRRYERQSVPQPINPQSCHSSNKA